MNVIGQLIFGVYQLNPKIQKLLKIYGNIPITEIIVFRKPIQKAVRTLLNVLSFGVFEKNFKNSNYDDIFHLYMIVKLNNNIHVKIEKNQRINIEKVNPESLDVDHIKISIPANLTMNILLNNARNLMKNNFFKYTASEYNCQNFIINILKSNNLLNDYYYKFIYQDAQVLFKNLVRNISMY